MKNLYELTVRKGNIFNVVANDPTEAQKELEKLLDNSDWWYSDDRKVIDIKLMATEFTYIAKKPYFPDKFRSLIIVPVKESN